MSEASASNPRTSATWMVVESTISKHAPAHVVSFDELAFWVCVSLDFEYIDRVLLALRSPQADPAARVILAEFVSEYCRQSAASPELLAAVDSVLDQVALAEQLVALINVADVQGQMVLAKRPAARLWIAYVIVRDNLARLGESHSIIRYCRQMIDQIRSEPF